VIALNSFLSPSSCCKSTRVNAPDSSFLMLTTRSSVPLGSVTPLRTASRVILMVIPSAIETVSPAKAGAAAASATKIAARMKPVRRFFMTWIVQTTGPERERMPTATGYDFARIWVRAHF
jgi:hypothetical protein